MIKKSKTPEKIKQTGQDIEKGILIWGTIVGTIILGVLFFYISGVVNEKPLGSSYGVDKEWLYPIWLGTVVSLYALVAVIRLKRLKKIIPVICLMISLLFIVSAQISYSFSSFQF